MHPQEAFWDYFWFAKLFLRGAGVLPFGGTPSWWKSMLTEIIVVSPLFYGFYIAIPQIQSILFRSQALDELLEAIIITITLIGGQVRVIFVFQHRRRMRSLFDVCEKFWNQATPEDNKVTSIWTQKARILSTTYFCSAIFAITAFIMTSTLRQLSSPVNSTTRYYPFTSQEDFSTDTQFRIKYMLQIIIAFLGMSYVVAADMTGTLLALNMCGQFALIRSWLVDISKEKSTIAKGKIIQNLDATLKKCIRRHQVVLDCCSELEKTTCYINLVQIITGMYNLAISVARLIGSFETSRRYFGTLFLAICCLFFSCWPADNLSFTSSEVAGAVYGTPWYNSPPRLKTCVSIMLIRSQRSVKLTAGKFLVMSLETFTSIVANGISFCMVLNSLQVR